MRGSLLICKKKEKWNHTCPPIICEFLHLWVGKKKKKNVDSTIRIKAFVDLGNEFKIYFRCTCYLQCQTLHFYL